jgi:hypothetical protein
MRLWKPDPYFLGAFTFAQMKALTGMPDGATVFCTSYPVNKGSLWRYSATLTDWFPADGPCKAYENTALITGLAQAADQALLAIPVEANLLLGKVFRMLVSLGKSGTTDGIGTFSLRLGSAGTTADAAIAQATTPTAANRSAGFEIWGRMASATSHNKLGGSPSAPWGAASSGTVLNAATTVATVASACFLTLTTTMSGAVDTPQLGYVALEIQP